MSKRFTDSDKWDDPWFCDLSPENKLFWNYLCDKCDHAGIWKVNLKLAEFHLGSQLDLSVFKDKIIWLSEGRIFIPGFLVFQYGTLKENSKVHISVLNKLAMEGVSIPFGNPMEWVKDKDKDKIKAKNKAKDLPDDTDFNKWYEVYPNKKAKNAAVTAWRKLKASGGLPCVQELIDATRSQIEYRSKAKGAGKFVPEWKHPATWLNGGCWADIEHDEPEQPKQQTIAPVVYDLDV